MRPYLAALVVLAGALPLAGPAPVAAQKAAAGATGGVKAPTSTGALASASRSQGGRAISFPRIEATYTVLRSGDVLVTERLTVRFDGSWNGVERQLRERATRHDMRPDEEREADPDRGDRDVDIEVLGATDADGNELRVESERRSGDYVGVRVWVPGASDAERVVVLRYRIERGVTFFANHDEFYWNVLGDESTAPVGAMEARVVPPEGVTGLRADAWAGAAGSSERNAVARVEGPMAVATTTAPLGPGLGFTIVVGWDAGVVERPGAIERLGAWLARYWSLALPFLTLGLMWRMWDRRGRDPAMLPIVTRYEPPDGVSPGEVGTLLDERADMRDVTATLVDLAVQGRLRIEEIEGTKLLGMEFGEDYRFVETSPPAGARALQRHEQKLLDALFSGRSQVELSDLKNEFYKDLPGIRDALMDSMVAHGIYPKRPDRIRAAWVAGGAAAGLGLFFLLGALGRTAPVAIFAIPVLSALPILVFGWLMPARTVKGTRIIERLRGFREFLSRVDGDRLRRMKIDPSAFERLLPFAMAMGVEKQFGEAFEGLAKEPPQWYHSRHGGAFHTAAFVSDLSRMSTTAASTMRSSPSSSGSGGSGGSGFSGGSVGGGGGGGGVGGF